LYDSVDEAIAGVGEEPPASSADQELPAPS
jgi:hypothetical protein